MINILIVVSSALFNNFGLSIIVLTIIVRGITTPLTLKQLRSTKALQELQPKMAELHQKYGKDKQKLAQEQMRMYKESGVNPAGCLLPMLIQLPIWISLFQSIIRVLAIVPEDFLKLSGHLYSAWPQVFSLVPLNSRFLWLDLAVPDRFLLLPILVGGTMWLQQKMVTKEDRGSQTAGAEPDDAVDNAVDVRLPHPAVPEWAGALLGGFQCHQHWHAVLHYWRLGWTGRSRGSQTDGAG